MKRVALFALLFVLLSAVAISQSYKTPWFESEVIRTDREPRVSVTRYFPKMNMEDDRLEVIVAYSRENQFYFRLTPEQSQQLAHALLRLSERPENVVLKKIP